jgi:hypothetical protein
VPVSTVSISRPGPGTQASLHIQLSGRVKMREIRAETFVMLTKRHGKKLNIWANKVITENTSFSNLLHSISIGSDDHFLDPEAMESNTVLYKNESRPRFITVHINRPKLSRTVNII